jgi:hypothetical protein
MPWPIVVGTRLDQSLLRSAGARPGAGSDDRWLELLLQDGRLASRGGGAEKDHAFEPSLLSVIASPPQQRWSAPMSADPTVSTVGLPPRAPAELLVMNEAIVRLARP